jgi:hypothetical protein
MDIFSLFNHALCISVILCISDLGQSLDLAATFLEAKVITVVTSPRVKIIINATLPLPQKMYTWPGFYV